MDPENIVFKVASMANLLIAHKGVRKGQALFNALHGVVPEFADSIRGTNLDPFYKKDHELDFQFMSEFWETLAAQINEESQHLGNSKA